MKCVAAEPPDFAWLVERTSCGLTSGFRAIKAVDEAGRIRGMVGYSGWTEAAVFCHQAVDTPIAWRALLKPTFEYPFVECGKRVMLGLIPASNTASWGMAKHLGFKIRHAIPDGWAENDPLLLVELRREDCRFLEAPHG